MSVDGDECDLFCVTSSVKYHGGFHGCQIDGGPMLSLTLSFTFFFIKLN